MIVVAMKRNGMNVGGVDDLAWLKFDDGDVVVYPKLEDRYDDEKSEIIKAVCETVESMKARNGITDRFELVGFIRNESGSVYIKGRAEESEYNVDDILEKVVDDYSNIITYEDFRSKYC